MLHRGQWGRRGGGGGRGEGGGERKEEKGGRKGLKGAHYCEVYYIHVVVLK